jgi:hypothetical protein
MNKLFKLLLTVVIAILSYLLLYFTAYYSAQIVIRLVTENEKVYDFCLPLSCSGFGMFGAVLMGTSFSPLSSKTMLNIFLLILVIMVILSSIPLFTKAFSIRPIAEIIGLTAGYLIARFQINKENNNENKQYS